MYFDAVAIQTSRNPDMNPPFAFDRLSRRTFLGTTAAFTALAATGHAVLAQALDAKTAQQIAIDAYIYGYSLITTDITRLQMSNVSTVEEIRAPLGTFFNVRGYPPATYRGVSATNADTLYSMAWLDLKEPMVFSHPEIKGRFFNFELVDLWMTVQHSVGTNTTGTDAETYLFTGPGWEGEVPKGMIHIAYPTRYLGVLGRTYALDTPEDLAIVHLGYVPHIQVAALFSNATALAYFSLFEGFGMPLLEAFHHGTPVICSNTTSLPEVGGDAVLSCDPTDVPAMAAAG